MVRRAPQLAGQLLSATRQLFAANNYLSLAAVGVLALCSAGIVFFADKLRQEVDYLAVANSDSVQWSLAQFEVELLELEAVMLLATSATDLSPVRTRFNIFYSRYTTVANSSQYATLRLRSDMAESLVQIRDYLDRTVPYIDGSDTALRGNLPQLIADTNQLRPLVRSISLVGVETFARTADERRQHVVQTLTRTASLVIGLIVVLMVMVLLLLLMVRLAWVTSKDHALVANRLASIVNTSLDGILVVDRHGKILNFNGAAERIFGYTRAEAIGQNMAELIIPAHLRDKHHAGMTRYLDSGRKRVIDAGRVRIEAMRKCGEIFPAELSLSTAKSKQGEIFVSYISDISEIVSAQADLVEARDKAIAGEKSKAAFIAVMSHEMRTPLNGLLGALDLLGDTAAGSSDHRALIDVMKKSGNLLLNHVNDVLDISQLEAGGGGIATQRFDANELVRDIASGQISNAKAHANTLVIDANDRSLSDVTGDPKRLRHILLNLVGNAIKFTRNGQITVQTMRLADGMASIEVTDTGIGIAADDLARIFDDFVTLDPSYARSASGTGLGLGIVQRLAKAMQGRITVTSTLGQGSRFCVQIPLAPWQDQKNETASTPQPAPAAQLPVFDRPLDILVVEDNEINRIVVRGMLEKSGHNVTEACDGHEGVSTANNRAFDVILMDISMPGMDGVLATQAIRNGTGPSKDAPIIAVTAHAMPADIARFEQARMNGTMIKPVGRDGLLRHIAAVTGAAQSSAPVDATHLVDITTLQAIRNDLGLAVAENLLAKFVLDTDRLMAALPSDISAASDRTIAINQVHVLSGSAAIFGAVQLRAQLSALENDLKLGHDVDWLRLRADVLATWQQSREVVQMA